MKANMNNRIQDKIKSIDELSTIVNNLKGEGRKIIQCHGVFDLLHIGHIRHLEAAKKYGDVLVITVTPDRYVDKGPFKPAFSEKLRAEAIAALNCVDYVAINEWPTALEAIKLLRPNIFVKGVEYSRPDSDRARGFKAEESAVREGGGKMVFTDEITFSSSSLISKYLHPFPKEVDDFLARFTRKYSSDEIINYVESLKALKVLVIGEAIVDEYQYGNPMGRARREPVIVFNVEKTEKYAGGALAIVNHVANFCQNVDLISLIGDHKSQEKFIRNHLNQNVKAMFYPKKDSPTVVKRRFIDASDNHKLFEVYDLKDTPLDERCSRVLSNDLKANISKYDLVIVCDAGHGLFTPEIIKTLDEAKYLSINTQDNPANFGFNTINKYQNPNYVCINESELRLATGSRYDDINQVIKERFEGTSINKVLVTRGWCGCIVYGNKELVDIPAFAKEIVDKVGAGDAVLSLTSPLAAMDVPIDAIGFIGNVAGAIAVSYPGNKESVQKEELCKHIKALMK